MKVSGRHLTSVFEAQEVLNTLLKALDASVNNLKQFRNSDELAPRLDALMPDAAADLTLFELIARSDPGPEKKNPVQVGLGKGVHPLVRVALAVLHVQDLGGKLTFQASGSKKGKKVQLTAKDYVELVEDLFKGLMTARKEAGKKGDF
jgi:hypothetical protein